jgi:hypothetical protein
MPITRRMFLCNTAAMSALPTFTSLGGILATMTGCNHHRPDPNSFYVLFEGPWIIDWPDWTKPTVRALTFGLLDDHAESKHQCPVGLGITDSYSLGNAADVNKMALPVMLGMGETWTILPRSGDTGAPPKPGAFTDLFDSVYGPDSFLYVKNSGMKVKTPRDTDRIVTLPMPDAVYLGGGLKTCLVNDATHVLAPLSGGPPPSPVPYCVVIFRYEFRPELVLTPDGRAQVDLRAGQHLVFRMIHQDNMSDVDHVRASLATLSGRVRNETDPLNLALSKEHPPISPLPPPYPGANPGGFDVYQMGLSTGTMSPNPQPGHLPRTGPSLADCCGGGVVLGN